MAAFVIAVCPEVVSITVIIRKILIAAFVTAISRAHGALHIVILKLMPPEATAGSILYYYDLRFSALVRDADPAKFVKFKLACDAFGGSVQLREPR